MERRNVAIIAHVDHGKTTLVDRILQQAHLFRENQSIPDLILDSNDLERERGITILSKNVSVHYKGVKINIIDTPGHSDFGGEVERVLNMADGVLLLVDAFEGPMPQTRFVLQKALEMGLLPIAVINKVDKPNCNPEEVNEQIFELMCSLDASEEQLEYPTVYGSSRQGWMSSQWKTPARDISFLLDTILDYLHPPEIRIGGLQLQISSLDYSPYKGRIAVGRVHRGHIRMGEQVAVVRKDGQIAKAEVKELYLFEGLGKIKTKAEVGSGEIVAVVGLERFEIGDTIADLQHPEPLNPIAVDAPSMSMLFTINDSPFYGREGQFVTSRHIRERLFKETEKNLALEVKVTASPDKWLVYGRGILHLSILVETMRREGYEFQLGQPRVVLKEINGLRYEPFECLFVDVSECFSGRVIEIVSRRKGDIQHIKSGNNRVRLEFKIPASGLIGINSLLLSATEGEAVISHRFTGFEPWKGEMNRRSNGALIAMETGMSIPYSIDKLQDRGTFFIEPNEAVYAGQVIGENTRQEDIVVNVVKTKKLSNMRASGADVKVSIAPAVRFSLEEAMEYVRADEYIEVTPRSLRLRKILLSGQQRKKARNQND